MTTRVGLEGIGGTGVLAVLKGAKPGKTLLIRADMDALPMAETTGRAYASQMENRNHSCGHSRLRRRDS